MAPRQQSSPLEDLIALASKLPWWISGLLALISYLILHNIAARPIIPMAGGPGQIGDAFSRGLVTTMALFGQYILPFAFGLGALISAINSQKQRKLYEGVKKRPEVASLNDMSWDKFETLVAEYFRRKGFRVTREDGDGPDGGIDLVLQGWRKTPSAMQTVESVQGGS